MKKLEEMGKMEVTTTVLPAGPTANGNVYSDDVRQQLVERLREGMVVGVGASDLAGPAGEVVDAWAEESGEIVARIRLTEATNSGRAVSLSMKGCRAKTLDDVGLQARLNGVVEERDPDDVIRRMRVDSVGLFTKPRRLDQQPSIARALASRGGRMPKPAPDGIASIRERVAKLRKNDGPLSQAEKDCIRLLEMVNQRARDGIELVRVYDLEPGDQIVLDDGSIQEVSGVDRGGCSKSQMRIRLRSRPPITVTGYYEPNVRRTLVRLVLDKRS